MQTASTMPTETAAQASRSGWLTDAARVSEPGAGVVQRHVRAGDRRRPGPAVCLQHVTVDQDLPLAEGFEIDHAAQGSADEALDLVGPPGLATLGRLPAHPFGRGAGQRASTPRSPSHGRSRASISGTSSSTEAVQRTFVLTRDGQHRTGGELGEVPDEEARAELVEGTTVVACEVRRSCSLLGVGHSGRVAPGPGDTRSSEVDDPLGALDDVVQVVGPGAGGKVLPASVAADEDDGSPLDRRWRT